MSRVVRPDSPARLRSAILDSIRSTLPALATTDGESELRDRLAFISLALRQLAASIEATTEAWERRSYWVKADQFRRTWAWAPTAEKALSQAVRGGDLATARRLAADLERRLPSERAARKQDVGRLWPGCYDRLQRAADGPPGRLA